MNSRETDYRKLKEAVASRGLFLKTPLYFSAISAVYLTLLAASVAILLICKNSPIQIANVFLFTFALVQLSFIGHDLAHHQIFSSRILHLVIGGLWWNLLLGIGLGRWESKHNKHHANPNEIYKDPDIDQPFIFANEQYRNGGVVSKKILALQHLYFFPLLTLAQISLIKGSVTHFTESKKTIYDYTEIALQLTHYTALFAIIFYSLGLLYGAVFTASSSLLIGAYLGLTFAPNHKGRPIIKSAMPPFVQQIITARNIKPGMFSDIIYGGLNYQIEHHLFPSMPRPNLHKARKYVKEFCLKNNIPYHETSIVGSLVEIYQGLKSPLADAI